MPVLGPFTLGTWTITRVLLGLFFLAWGAMILFHLPVSVVIIGLTALVLGILILAGA